MRIDVRFSARALVSGNHGIDVNASASRYAEHLREAITRDFPLSALSIASDDGAGVRVEVTGVDLQTARATERAVLDLAWVVKQCAPWSVPISA